MLEFQLIGPFGLVNEDGHDRRPKLMKSRAILALLAATPGHRVSRRKLRDLLWSDRQKSQAQSSLRTSLNEIRKHLGEDAPALKSDHTEISLVPGTFSIDLKASNSNCPDADFLAGFHVPNAPGFETWLAETRASLGDRHATVTKRPSGSQHALASAKKIRIILASVCSNGSDFIRMQCDTLVDCLAKYIEDLGLAEFVEGRGRFSNAAEILETARIEGCDFVLVCEAAELSGNAVARIKVIDTKSSALIYSKSMLGAGSLNLDNPNNVVVGAEFADILFERLARDIDPTAQDLSPQLSMAAGVRHIFKLGTKNFDLADQLLKESYAKDATGISLAWRSYLRTFLIGELEYRDKEVVVEEGAFFAREAIASDPNNSLVLALCAHSENMLHDNYHAAYTLSSRALEINRCNPLAWATLGLAAAFLGKAEDGYAVSSVGARLTQGSVFEYQTQLWASASGMLAGKLEAARLHSEHAHSRAPEFAPPMRFLSALYCHDEQFERAAAMANSLRSREPGFSLEVLGDDGYPADCIRQAKLISTLPTRQI